MIVAKYEDNDVYITSDTHFNHGNIIKYCHRPFLAKADAEAFKNNGYKWHDGKWKSEHSPQHNISIDSIMLMNAAIIDNINKTVPSHGLLIHLGDFAINNGRHKALLTPISTIVSRINCDIIMVWGNHDTDNIKEELSKTCIWTGDSATLNIGIMSIELSHYCHAVWNKSHRGAFHLYGHSHSEIEKNMDLLMPGRRSMDVGIDNANKLVGEYRPLSLIGVCDMLSTRPGFSINPNTPTNFNGKEEGELQ